MGPWFPLYGCACLVTAALHYSHLLAGLEDSPCHKTAAAGGFLAVDEQTPSHIWCLLSVKCCPYIQRLLQDAAVHVTATFEVCAMTFATCGIIADSSVLQAANL